MRAATLALTAAVGLATMAISAQAAPLAPATAGEHSAAIVRIAGGCGFGWHPTPFGYCAPNHFRRLHRVIPRDYIEEWDEYDTY